MSIKNTVIIEIQHNVAMGRPCMVSVRRALAAAPLPRGSGEEVMEPPPEGVLPD
jgi:hypothetical protein